MGGHAFHSNAIIRNPADPDLLTMALAALGIGLVAALAGYVPARRATGIDPMRALRWE